MATIIAHPIGSDPVMKRRTTPTSSAAASPIRSMPDSRAVRALATTDLPTA